jgi:hypothetical protein
MGAYSDQSGNWNEVKNIYAKNSGNWSLVKRGFVNNHGTWQQFHSGNTYKVYSLGLEQSLGVAGGNAGNVGVWENGPRVSGGTTRSYTLTTFDKYGNVLTAQSYDVFGDSTNYANAGSATQNLIAALNGIAAGAPYVLCTYDEPATNASALNGAMTSLFGGISSIITSSMPYRGAYLAIGTARQAPAIEQYCGTFVNSVSNPAASTSQTDDGCADGALIYSFRIYNGQFANVSALYTGGGLVTNSNQTGGISVPGLA